MTLLNKKSLDDAERYLSSVVCIPDEVYYAILLRIYDNGYLTSAGFFDEVLVSDRPQSIEDQINLPVAFGPHAATELPTDFMKRKCVLFDDRDMLEETATFMACLEFLVEDPEHVIQKLVNVNIEQAVVLANTAHPQVDADVGIYTGTDGEEYAWCLLLPMSINN